jgi:large subunit ribosomal protein L9
MKVILREDVPDIGSAGQTVDVKDGFGRNYLIPRNLAIPATKATVKAIEEIDRQKQVREKKRRRGAELVKEKIEKISVSAEVLVGEEDKVFGSVTSRDVAALLEEQGVTVDRRMVQLEEPIKTLGVFTVPIKLDKEVTANLKLWVIKKT